MYLVKNCSSSVYLYCRFKDIFQEVYEQEGWKAKFDAAGIW